MFKERDESVIMATTRTVNYANGNAGTMLPMRHSPLENASSGKC